MKRQYRYKGRSIALECMQGAAGFALTGGLLMGAQPAGLAIWALAAAAGLFLVYFGRAVVRYLTRIELDERGIQARGPLGAVIPWDEISSLQLDHYTTRSDRSGGWMQLDVRGARRSIRIDSSLTEFAVLAAAVAREASRRGKPLDERTRFNFGSLGISLHG